MTIPEIILSSTVLAVFVGISLYFLLRQEENSLTRWLQAGLSHSRWALVGGGESSVYYDLDKALANPSSAPGIAASYEEMVDDLAREAAPIHKLAFIDKSRGPVGAITLKDLLVKRTGLPAIIVRPRRRLIAATVKGSATRGERVIVVSDVATSGGTVLEAVDKLERHGLSVAGVVVFLARDAATERSFAGRGIPLRYVADQASLEKLETKEHTPSSPVA